MKKIYLISLTIFALLSLIGIWHHEIWLDEAHHYLFASDSNSIAELVHNMRYDGHPILWNLILFGITRYSHDVIFMQLANVVIAVAAVFVFLYYSPFTLVEKILFVSGYFVLYEYTVISRNYALFMLFFFLSIVLYKKKKYLWFGISLAILANTHLFGLLVAFCWFGMHVLVLLTDKKEKISRQEIIGLLIFLIGALISLWQIIPPPDSNYLSNVQRVSTIDRLGRTSAVFLKGFIPIPDFTNYHFWNTNVLMSISKPFCVMLSAVLFAIPFFLFRKKLSVALFFYGNCILLLCFFFLTDLNAARYYGVIYLIFVSCVWLNGSLPEIRSGKNYSRLFFIGLLIVHTFAGIIAYAGDIARPFSESKDAAEAMLKDQHVTEYLSSGCAAPISAYVGKKIYELNSKQYESYCSFFGQSKTSFLSEEYFIKKESVNFVKLFHRSAFLIARVPLNLSPGDLKNISYQGAFDKSILRGENYYIYKVVE